MEMESNGSYFVAASWLILSFPARKSCPTQILGKLKTRFVINMDYKKIYSVHEHLKKAF